MSFEQMFAEGHDYLTVLLFDTDSVDRLLARIKYVGDRCFVPSVKKLFESYLLSNQDIAKIIREKYFTMFTSNPGVLIGTFKSLYTRYDHSRSLVVSRYNELLTMISEFNLEDSEEEEYERPLSVFIHRYIPDYDQLGVPNHERFMCKAKFCGVCKHT